MPWYARLDTSANLRHVHRAEGTDFLPAVLAELVCNPASEAVDPRPAFPMILPIHSYLPFVSAYALCSWETHMRIARISIENFRGIKKGELLFPKYVVLAGDNNCGKSTVIEAIDLCLGPERLNRHPVIDEHDFYAGEYLGIGESHIEIKVEVVVVDLSEEQQRDFRNHKRNGRGCSAPIWSCLGQGWGMAASFGSANSHRHNATYKS